MPLIHFAKVLHFPQAVPVAVRCRGRVAHESAFASYPDNNPCASHQKEDRDHAMCCHRAQFDCSFFIRRCDAPSFSRCPSCPYYQRSVHDSIGNTHEDQGRIEYVLKIACKLFSFMYHLRQRIDEAEFRTTRGCVVLSAP